MQANRFDHIVFCFKMIHRGRCHLLFIVDLKRFIKTKLFSIFMSKEPKVIIVNIYAYIIVNIYDNPSGT